MTLPVACWYRLRESRLLQHNRARQAEVSREPIPQARFDHWLLMRPPDVLAYANALAGSIPSGGLITIQRKKEVPMYFLFLCWYRLRESNP